MERLENRIQRMEDEDAVRNLMHAHGYYIDRRIWTDVVDLHTENKTVQDGSETALTGKAGIRQALERTGPEDSTQGISNRHPVFDMIVGVAVRRKEATAYGIEGAMLGNANFRVASWEFHVFRNRFVKEDRVWKVQNVEITPLVVADYYIGWGKRGVKSLSTYTPPFMNVTRSPMPLGRTFSGITSATLDNLERHLQRSAAYDRSEDQSHAYGYFLDDLQAEQTRAVFAKRGYITSPFAGLFQAPERITRANQTS
jgi:hypothetical protein